MASTRFYLDMRGRAADGKGSLYVSLYDTARRIYLPLGVRLKPSEWKNETVVNRPDSKELNAYITRKKAEIDLRLVIVHTWQDNNEPSMTTKELKNYLLTGDKKEHQTIGLRISDAFKEVEKQNMSEGSRKIYESARDKVIGFAGEQATVKDIDYRWLVSFDAYMAKSQSVNGRAIYMRHLKAVCNYAVKTGVLQQSPFKCFKIKTEPTEKRNISVETLREFYNFPVDKSKVRYRDYFFLMFYLIGINAVDLLHATPDMVQDGRLFYKRTKTHKNISILIQPEAQELMDKYKGKKYLLEALDNVGNYKNFLHRMNDALGQIGPVIKKELPAIDLFGIPEVVTRVEPIVPDITSYFARHTWATLAHKIGISSDVVGLALGHSNRARVTWIYIEPDMSQVDKANRKVIDYFLNRQS